MTIVQELTSQRIDHIEALLKELTQHLEQEKSDLDKADWTTAGELGYIVEKLAEVDAFWTGGE
jgi:hypothetical protein